MSLARQIDEENLRNFLEVRPRHEVLGGLILPYEWQIISGHRRFAACSRILKWDTIPCHIRHGLSEDDAVKQNATENFEQSPLTFMEEAVTIRKRFPGADTDVRIIAATFKRPVKWVKARLAALELPQKLQRAADRGDLSQFDIEKVSRLPTQEARIALAEQIMGQNSQPVAAKPKRPTKAEIQRKMVELYESRGEGSWLHFARWTLGQISEEELDLGLDNEG